MRLALAPKAVEAEEDPVAGGNPGKRYPGIIETWQKAKRVRR
jgi:hypothetical protein